MAVTASATLSVMGAHRLLCFCLYDPFPCTRALPLHAEVIACWGSVRPDAYQNLHIYIYLFLFIISIRYVPPKKGLQNGSVQAATTTSEKENRARCSTVRGVGDYAAGVPCHGSAHLGAVGRQIPAASAFEL